MYSAIKFFLESSHSKFSRKENSQEMLDQYYQNKVTSLYPVVKFTIPKYSVLLSFLPYQYLILYVAGLAR